MESDTQHGYAARNQPDKLCSSFFWMAYRGQLSEVMDLKMNASKLGHWDKA